MSGHQVAEPPMTERTDLESGVRPVSVAARARHRLVLPNASDAPRASSPRWRAAGAKRTQT
jgi:hypothetical protein